MQSRHFANTAWDIDERTGFLSAQPPLRRLPGVYELWESLLDEAFACVRTPGCLPNRPANEAHLTSRWRARIRKMRVLSTVQIENDAPKARRAHHVLAYLTQFYVQSLPPTTPSSGRVPPVVIPAPIAVPLVAISRRLGIAPILTYADTVLWNWEKCDLSLPVSRTNIRMVDLLTGSPQEELFFRTSVMIEIRGWEALDAMANCIVDSQSLRCSSEWGPGIDAEAPASNLAFHLERLGKTLDDMTWILKDIRRGLDPDFFYNKFRPWIQGADQGADSPSWLYESVDGTGLLLQPSGPSAGQSALMQSFDAFLDVLHPHSKLNLGGGCTRFNASLDPNNLTLGPLPEGHPSLSGSLSQKSSVSLTPLTPPETPAYSPAVDAFNVSRLLVSLPTQPEGAITSGPKSAVDTSFNARMRSYMTQGQQDFLSWLREHSIRPFIESLHFSDSSPSTDYLSTCQKATIIQAYDACLMALKRWRDAHILIVTEYVIIPARKPTSILSHIPSWKSGDVEEPKAVRGTGGTSLIPLLKIYRDNTLRALLSPLRLY